LLYIQSDKIGELENSSSTDFTVTVMHHAPDFYKDDIKNSIEERVIGGSSILFYGHENDEISTELVANPVTALSVLKDLYLCR
jgi:hypothetical protein